MKLKRALETPGWLTVREAMWLAGAASHSNRTAEIGSWKGRSTLALAMNTRGTVFAIDTWRGSPEHQAELAGKHEDWLLEQFIANVDDVDNVVPWIGRSLDIAKQCSDSQQSFDLIFLDASHDYANVKADILAWRPLLQGGWWSILCGHDYDPPNWMGVHQAVNECCPGFEVVPGTTIWFVRGKE